MQELFSERGLAIPPTTEAVGFLAQSIMRDIFRSVVRMAREKSGYETGGFDIMKQFQKKQLKKQKKKKTASETSLKKEMKDHL